MVTKVLNRLKLGLDAVPARWRHMAIALIASAIAPCIPWAIDHAPVLVDMGVKRFPYLGWVAPVVTAAIVGVLLQVTPLVRQYGLFQDPMTKLQEAWYAKDSGRVISALQALVTLIGPVLADAAGVKKVVDSAPGVDVAEPVD